MRKTTNSMAPIFTLYHNMILNPPKIIMIPETITASDAAGTPIDAAYRLIIFVFVKHPTPEVRNISENRIRPDKGM